MVTVVLQRCRLLMIFMNIKKNYILNYMVGCVYTTGLGFEQNIWYL